MAESNFTSLLQEIEQVSVELGGVGGLPQVERTPRQILEASQDLWARVTATGTQETRANLLLGSKGVDLTQLTQKLESLSSKETSEPEETDYKTDFSSDSDDEVNAIIDEFFIETHKMAIETFHEEASNKIHKQWEERRAHQIAAMMSKHKPDAFVTVPISLKKMSLDLDNFKTDHCLEPIERQYAQVLIEYNHTVISTGDRLDLIDKFSKISPSQKVQESWDVVKHMIQIPKTQGKDPLINRTKSHVKLKIIELARTYLEDRYLDYMHKFVDPGGIHQQRLETSALIRQFVCAFLSKHPQTLDNVQVNGCPLWALIYFCIRCGVVQEAVKAAHKAGPAFSEITKALEEFKVSRSCRLSSNMERLLQAQYNASPHNTDPFKRAVYNILGKFDLTNEHSELVLSIEDYLWFKVSLLQENTKDTSGPEHSKLSHLQTLIIKEQGEKYYSKSEDPYIYFKVLFLTGLFEAAVEYLVRQPEASVHGIHMAIALYELQLLGLPRSVHSPLVVADPCDPPYLYRYNVIKLVLKYANAIATHHVLESLHYCFCFRDSEDVCDDNVFLLSVVDLLSATKKYNLVLGEVGADNRRKPGLLDQFRIDEDEFKTVVNRLAISYRKEGLYLELAKLFDLIQEPGKVIKYLTPLLFKTVSNEDSDCVQSRSEVLEYCKGFQSRNPNKEVIECDAYDLEIFFHMMNFVTFFDFYFEKKYDEAKSAAHSLNILPSNELEVVEKVNIYQHCKREVKFIYDDLVVAMMTILHSEYCMIMEDVKTGNLIRSSNVEEKLFLLKEEAKALMLFTSSPTYCLPVEKSNTLYQMYILIH